MKKILSAIAFAVCILSVNFCSAVDVWVESDEVYKTDYYLMTHHIKENYQDLTFFIGLKSVFQEGHTKGEGYQFVYENGTWYVVKTFRQHDLELVKVVRWL